jgi:hypothetical protein
MIVTMSLETIAESANLEIEQQRELRRQTNLIADQHSMEPSRTYYAAIDKLEPLHGDRVFEIASGLGIPPCNAQGGLHQPTTVPIETEGGKLTRDINDRAPCSLLVAFPEVEELIQTREADS